MEHTEMTADAVDNTPALPTEEKTTAAEAVATWVCPEFKVSGVFSSHLTECDPQIMVISDDRGHTVTLEDILIGDVWLIGGQSNAELTMGPCMTLTPSLDFYEGDNFRLFAQ